MSRSPPTLHLYRHLLRQSSYLTLPQSRIYIKDYIVAQFHRHRAAATWPPSEPLSEERKISLHRKARKFLSLLTRANLGHYKPFKDVLKLTFARKGPRRRQLMQQLMHPASPEPHPSPQSVLSEPGTQWKPPATIQALMRSQRMHQDYFTQVDYKIKPNGPALPKQTIWGKPVPRCRVKNATKKWYAIHVDRLYPPLPESEYQSILAIVEGTTKISQKRQRMKASVRVFTKEDSHSQVDNVLEDPKKKQKKLLGRPIRSKFVQRRMLDLLGHIPRAMMPTDPEKPMVYAWREANPGTRVQIHKASKSQAQALFA